MFDQKTVTRVTPSVTPVTPAPTVTPSVTRNAPAIHHALHDAESEAFETDPQNDPATIIKAWIGEDLSGSDLYRLNNAITAMRAQGPVRIVVDGPCSATPGTPRNRRVSRLELFVRALKAMRNDGTPYNTMVGTLNYCAAVVARCERDALMPNEWPRKATGAGKPTAQDRRRRREQDTDWSTPAGSEGHAAGTTEGRMAS